MIKFIFGKSHYRKIKTSNKTCKHAKELLVTQTQKLKWQYEAESERKLKEYIIYASGTSSKKGSVVTVVTSECFVAEVKQTLDTLP
mgnify:CR=1 FL=1